MSRARTGSRPSGNPRRTRGPGHAGSSDLRVRRSGDGETGSRTSVSTRRQEVRRRRSSPHCRTGIETEPATEDGTLRSGVRRARDDRQAVRIAEGRNAAGHPILVSCRRAGAHAKERTERQFPADEYGQFPARLPEGTPGCRPPDIGICPHRPGVAGRESRKRKSSDFGTPNRESPVVGEICGPSPAMETGPTGAEESGEGPGDPRTDALRRGGRAVGFVLLRPVFANSRFIDEADRAIGESPASCERTTSSPPSARAPDAGPASTPSSPCRTWRREGESLESRP